LSAPHAARPDTKAAATAVNGFHSTPASFGFTN
jgi:hypothetical protein